jgi:hypothetical protein
LSNDESDWWSIFLSHPFPETIGLTEISELNVGLHSFFMELREAESEFAAGNQLDGAYLSLVAVIGLISLFEPVRREGLFVPLAALESALLGLGEGIVEPILKPSQKRKDGRSPSPGLNREIRGAVAYVVQRLCDFGCSREDAFNAVAADLKRIGVKPDRGSGSVTNRTVRGWYEKVMADVGFHGDAARRCRQLLSSPSNTALDQMPREMAISLLRTRLKYFVKALGGKAT